MTYSSELSYPAREHLHLPTDAIEWIDEELRTGGEGRYLRASIGTELHAMYSKSELTKSFRWYADALLNAKMHIADSRQEHATESSPHTFYVGALLATHATLQPLDKDMRQAILRQGCDDAGNVVDSFAEIGEEKQHMNASMYDAVNTFLLTNSDELKSVVITAAERAYSDFPRTQAAEYEVEFMFGYAFSAQAIKNIHTALERMED